MVLIWIHVLVAVSAIVLGLINLISKKGTRRHRIFGWSWVILLAFVTVPSFWIRESSASSFSWLHLLSVWTIICMAVALISIRRGHTRRHANFMIGTMIGIIIAGVLAMAPGRFLSTVLGYG